jgi:predicted protein tyrosine phosphatase
MKILFVCTQNACRSPTAEWLYAENPEHQVASAGVAPDAEIPLDRDMLLWADRTFVFKMRQRSRIRRFAPDLYGRLTIECLFIPDELTYKDEALIGMLSAAQSRHLGPPRRRLLPPP